MKYYIKDIKKIFTKKLLGTFPDFEINSFFYTLIYEYSHYKKIDIITNNDLFVNESIYLKILSALRRLKRHEPVQYILNKSCFYNTDFYVNNHVLIPRPETELLVDIIIKESKFESKLNIIDIGTGSGCIAVSLKKKLFESEVYALDYYLPCLKVAMKNAIDNNIRINFIKLDILQFESKSDFPEFDIIVSNPPYVCQSESKLMKSNVLNYEPSEAIFVKDDNPLIFYDRITDFAISNKKTKLKKLYFEINEKFLTKIMKMFHQKGLTNILPINDFNNKPRFISCNM